MAKSGGKGGNTDAKAVDDWKAVWWRQRGAQGQVVWVNSKEHHNSLNSVGYFGTLVSCI